MRIQQVENAMFDLANSEADHPEESIRSLDNSSERLIQVAYDTISADWQYNPVTLNNKMNIINEIDHQNLSDVSGWAYIEDNMRLTANYIFEKCVKENLDMHEFISRETSQSNHLLYKGILRLSFIGLLRIFKFNISLKT